MHDLTRFTLADMSSCGGALRRIASGASSMEEAANRVCGSLYDELRDATTGERQCVLVRLYVTQPRAATRSCPSTWSPRTAVTKS